MANEYKLVDGKRVQLTDEEQKEYESRGFSDAQELAMLRRQRDALLVESDWTQNRDVTLSNDADWKTYRQALRDITKTYKTLDTVKWPTEPTS